MADAVETTDEVETVDDAIDAEQTVTEQVEDPTEGLRKALQAERKAHREAERARKAAEQALADKDKPAEEAALDQARRQAREEAMSAANVRLVRAELKAALAGKVANPAIALRLIDASEIGVTDEGDVDEDAVAAAVANLLDEAPELAVKGTRFPNGADQGANGKGAAPQQLTQTDIESMTPEQIVEARKAGRLNKLLGVE